MRKLLFILITLTYTYIANAQVLDSITIAVPQYSDTSSKFTNAKGWLLQNDGKWVSENNIIPNDKTVIHHKSSEYKFGKENFSSIELTPFLFQNISYVLMVVKFTEGNYEFPNLKSNWKTNKAAYFYVFKKENLRYLIPDVSMVGKPFSVNLDIYCSGYINLDTDKLGIKNNVNEIIIKTNQNVLKNFTNLIFSLYPIEKDDKVKILFKLIKTYTKKTLYEYYLQPSLQEQIFSKFYYEADFDNFHTFITKCLKDSETFKKQITRFSKDNNSDEKDFKSNYETIQNQFKSFNTSYEALKVDTSNFYAAPKISRFADTVAATSYIKPTRGNKKGKEKIIEKPILIISDSLLKAKTDTNIIIYISDSIKQGSSNNHVDTIIKRTSPDTVSHKIIQAEPLNPLQKTDNETDEITEKIILRVQIASASDNLSEVFYRKKHNINEKIYIIPAGKLFKYAVGEFYSFSDAIAYKQIITNNFNISGAFIIAIKNGKLISIAEARKIIKQ